MYSTALRLAGLWALSLLLLGQTSGVSAAIYACPGAGGTTIFQDRPCPRVVPVESRVMLAARSTLGIHESWFKKPEFAQGRAFCDRRGCECDKHERDHGGSLAMAVADALYIDASWHRYDVSETTWLETATDSPDRHLYRDVMIEASCSVMMSQQLLRQFAQETAAKLKKQAQQAEEYGFDIPDACDSGNATACDFYDASVLYQRLSRDANALRTARDDLK